MAKDDKEAVGDTMLMDDKQKEYLSALEVGNAIVFSEHTEKPVHVHIRKIVDTDEEQIELAEFVDEMNKKGAKIVVSNSDPKNTNEDDEFFDNIYSNHRIKRVEATRMINSNSQGRGKIKELLISNF